MARTIWKFPIALMDVNNLIVPTGAKPLCVQTQYEVPCVWFLIDASDTPVDNDTWEIRIYGTGYPVISKFDDYIGTFQIEGGSLVFHTFARNMSNVPKDNWPQGVDSNEGENNA